MNSSYKKENENHLTNTMERVEYNLNKIIEASIKFTYNLYTDSLLDEFLNKKYDNYLEYYYDYRRMLTNNNFSYNYNYGMLYKIMIYADNNTLINGANIGTLDTIITTQWYQAFEESGKEILLYTYYDEGKRFIPGSGSSRTISIIRSMDHFGLGIKKLLKIDLDYNLMQREVLNEKIDGVIYVRNPEYILFSNLPGAGSTRDYIPANTVKEDNVTMKTTFTAGTQEWEILIFAEDTAFWPMFLKSKGLFFLVLFNILFPSVLIYFVGRSISKRLSVVMKYMGKVKKEKFEVIDIKEGKDEIGNLIRSYNLMVIKIKDLIEVVFKGNAEKQALELSKKQAELKAVQSQVNPHFLFNTLETIRMRSLLKNETETADIIGELAVLFRKSMNWGSDFVTIEEEMTFAEKYINIQKYRFGDKIKYFQYIKEECKKYLVPKLSIVTFIENACIHGIEASITEGVISVTITNNGDFMFIEISDNGIGFEKQKLESIRKMISNADIKMLNESKSTGILNAFLRLKMYCDDNILFDIDSVTQNGTDIMIQIPLSCMDGIFA
ncbi:histidine kinase [Mobilitalea sibirica]|uniref:Histidine kinase n=1 Tax=Mobilitalea sibirica TaxID=1462919 RepID=A0A8J7HDM2_9FIRM|nr:histidine kinase [Mobilitalea sibirica]MBH1942232.1 histidine kinase [Mobilitalea sibirica]